MRSRPGGRIIWRILVIIVGGVLTIGGLALIPLPGPGWVIVFLGLAVLGTEFAWAERLLVFARTRVAGFGQWVTRQPLWVRGLLGALTALIVVVVVAAYFAWQGWWPFNG